MKEIQPAKKSYFFEKGYQDVKNTIKDAWRLNMDSVQQCRTKLKELKITQPSKAKRIFLYILNLIALLSILICGSVLIVMISALNILVLVVAMGIIYIGFTIVWLIDRIYLQKNKIFTACTECNSRFLIPTYVCPGCGAKHTNLTPGVYGILHRTCLGTDPKHFCGEKLPTTFLNGRNKLETICPVCNEGIGSRESVPLCIAVVGGRSVGKTSFVNAFSKNFIEQVAPNYGLETEFYNDKKREMYEIMMHDFEIGDTRMTEHSADRSDINTATFSFFVNGEGLKRERLVHLYDIAGEVFSDQNVDKTQKHLGYCQGVAFILDPLSIPEVCYAVKDELLPEDAAGIGGNDIDEVFSNFINKLTEASGMSQQSMSQLPIAIIINKMDVAHIADEIGAKAITALMKKDREVFDDYFNTEDFLCRKFLRKNGLSNFVNAVESRFQVNRFFSCSAIGHARGTGMYKPLGIVQPMQWLFGRADEEMGRIWNTVTFTKEIPEIEEIQE